MTNENTAVASSKTLLPIVEEAEATGDVAQVYQDYRDHFGRPSVPGILKCFATHPPLVRQILELAKALIFADGHLSRLQKEMIATLVSHENRCAYCADSHGYALRQQGGSVEALCAIQNSTLASPALSPAEQALLTFAQKVNSNSHSIKANDIESLVNAGWSALQIAEAIHIAALFATFNRVANSFGLSSQGLLSLIEDLVHTCDPSHHRAS
jgi:uncharacterized peroxidase-related enzyme